MRTYEFYYRDVKATEEELQEQVEFFKNILHEAGYRLVNVTVGYQYCEVKGIKDE